MPDEALLTAASEGQLDERQEVIVHVQRLIADPRAVATVQMFHDQLLESSKLDAVMPSAVVYGPQDTLGRDAARERQRYVAHIFEQGGSFSDLLTSTETFVNAELAAVYGLAGDFDDNFVLVDLDPSERAGLFTHVGFLATHATSVDPDPIHRGKFLAERFACKQISAPPTDVPPPPAVSDKTNRQRIADYTEAPGTACAACHATVINPFGFPFESFDAVGAYRTEDQGKPVDTHSTLPLDGESVDVVGAIDVAMALAASQEVHRCYIKHWLEFAHGRHEHALDETRIARLAERSQDEGAPVAELLTELVLSEGFLTRSSEEAP